MWLSWLEHSPVRQKVSGSIPSRCLQVPSLVRVHMGGNQSMFFSHIKVSLSLSLFLSLFPTLPLSLKSINIFKNFLFKE